MLQRKQEVPERTVNAESMMHLDFGSTDSTRTSPSSPVVWKRAYACSRTGRLLPNVLSSHPVWRSGKRVPLTRSDPTGGGDQSIALSWAVPVSTTLVRGAL